MKTRRLTILGALALTACTLDGKGLGPNGVDASGGGGVSRPDVGLEMTPDVGLLQPDTGAEPDSAATSDRGVTPDSVMTDGAVMSDARAADTLAEDVSQPTVDARADVVTASDAPGDRSGVDVGTDAETCKLPAGATICCGSMACTDHGASCRAPGFCASCHATCTDPRRPVCCALRGQTTCEVLPSDC